MSKLKDKILEIADIAKACPDNLQAICFELLLRDYLGTAPPKPAQTSGTADSLKDTPGGVAKEKEPTLEDIGKGQEDLADSDLHVKVRHFLKKHDLTLSELSNLFYKQNDQILSLCDDLKTTRLAESQVRIALLRALHRAIQTGDFECTVDEIRAECNDRKCYDKNNFSNNFTNNAQLFDFGKKYNKSVAKMRLSEDGKKELADVIKELQ